MTATVGEIIVAALRDQGSDYAFCVPGESYLPVLDAFHDICGIEPVTTHHEEGAGFMAHAWARATGRTGVAMVTRGPGITHATIALHAARQDSVPLLVIAGQVPQEHLGREAFQEIDLVRLGGIVGKAGIEITQANRAAEQIQRALYLANSGRPGPVLVSLPENVGYGRTEVTAVAAQPVPLPNPQNADLDRAAELLADARSVAVIAGGGVLRSGATPVLTELVELLGAAVYGGWRRFDAFSNTHPQFCGNLPWLPAELTETLRTAEVVVAVGTRLGEFSTLTYRVPADRQRLVQIDLAADELSATRSGDVPIVGDASSACQGLLERLRGRLDPAVAERRRLTARGVATQYARLSEPPAGGESGSVNVGAAIGTLRDLLPAEAAITSDAGSFAGYLNRYYRWRKPGTFFGTTSGAMGYAVPAAVGVKLAQRGRPVVAVAGDGGFAMTMSEVHTAVRLGLEGLVFVVFDNGVYGTIKAHQQRHYPGREIAIEQTSADLARVAQGLGAHGLRVTSNAEFADGVKMALAASTPTVVQAMTSPTQIGAWAE